MKKAYNVIALCYTGLLRVLRSVGFVNVFKKKSAEHRFAKAKLYFTNLNWTQKFFVGYFSGTIIITIFRVLL